MSLSIYELEVEARQLPAAERADLAQRLFASLEDEEPAGTDDEVDQEWVAEAERRYERYRAGKTRSVPAADALARVRASLDQR